MCTWQTPEVGVIKVRVVDLVVMVVMVVTAMGLVDSVTAVGLVDSVMAVDLVEVMAVGVVDLGTVVEALVVEASASLVGMGEAS